MAESDLKKHWKSLEAFTILCFWTAPPTPCIPPPTPCIPTVPCLPLSPPGARQKIRIEMTLFTSYLDQAAQKNGYIKSHEPYMTSNKQYMTRHTPYIQNLLPRPLPKEDRVKSRLEETLGPYITVARCLQGSPILCRGQTARG